MSMSQPQLVLGRVPRRHRGGFEVEAGDVVGGVPARPLLVVEPRWGNPFGYPVDDVDGPAAAFELAVVECAQQAEVVEVGGAAGQPGVDVVGLAPGRGAGAAGK